MLSHPRGARSTSAASIVAVAIIALSAAIDARAETDASWQTLLRLQLQDTQKCVMSGTVFVRELPIGNGIAYSGRAICLDGRMFDFSQSKPHLKFEITSCDPTYC